MNRSFAKQRVRRLIADGFAKRQREREERRKYWNEKTKAHIARQKALEAALALKRNSAFPSSPAVDRGKLPKTKSAAGGQS